MFAAKLSPPLLAGLLCGGVLLLGAAATSAADTARWHIGTPIATYWAGPAMTDATAAQMADGGFNVVWCSADELDTVQRHGMRAFLQSGLIAPETLDDPAKRQELDALVDRVKGHPALYGYFITDEPNSSRFPALGKLVAYFRERDPGHLAYINLFPTYATNEQLGTKGDVETAYAEHLRQYVDVVKPDLNSYDHYHFTSDGDSGQYFLNLGMIRQKAVESGLPFLNTIQACTWTPAMRVPNGDELAWLVYTSLAYGAQGISYFVYYSPGIQGAMANDDTGTTPLYDAASRLNREFVAIASELQPLESLGAYHIGKLPLGAEALPDNSPVKVVGAEPAEGLVVGLFGRDGTADHAVIVNRDYKQGVRLTLGVPRGTRVYGGTAAGWSPARGSGRVTLWLDRGAGALVRWDG